MNVRMVRTLRTSLLALVIATAPSAARAEVTRVELKSRTAVLGGKSFANVGPYEKILGTIYFALDPEHPENKKIVDLDKAPRNAKGQVEFSSDLFVLQPKDPSRGNGALFFDVVNRGNKQLLRKFNRATSADDPVSEAEYGDGFLMREGYTIVAVGWENAPNGVVTMKAPVASEHGEPIEGWIQNWFIPTDADLTFELTSQYWTGFKAYPPLNPDDPLYVLTERLGFHGTPKVIPREQWKFGKIADMRLTYDAHHIFLENKFKPGYTYELKYKTKDPRVAGVGFAAIRDAATYFKTNPSSLVKGKYAYAFGESQTGRFLRVMLHQNFTTGEDGRRAIDGVWIHVGGASLGSFNDRFAQPNEGGFHSTTAFPLHYATTRDPVTGKEDGLGARIPAGLHPKVFMVESSSEYWDRGRVTALNHTTIDGTQDAAPPDNVRLYLLAGIPHAAGPFPPSDLRTQQLKGNLLDTTPALRALITAMNAWVQKGDAAPASRHPTLAAGTLIKQAAMKFPKVPGVQWPVKVPGGYRADLPGPLLSHPLPFLVPQVDADGNETSGLRVPEQAVPLGTFTGWAFRSKEVGAPTEIMAMVGGYVPFARTRAERERSKDPRLSIEERYADRADYLKRIEEVTRQLIEDRLVCEEDVTYVVNHAGQHWDWLMAQGKAPVSGRRRTLALGPSRTPAKK